MSQTPRSDDQDHRLSRASRASIWSLRAILGGTKAENLISRLGFSDLRSFFYHSLVRTSISYHGPQRIFRKSVSYYEFGVGWGYTLSRYIEALKAFCKDEHLDQSRYNIFLFDSFVGLPEKQGPF